MNVPALLRSEGSLSKDGHLEVRTGPVFLIHCNDYSRSTLSVDQQLFCKEMVVSFLTPKSHLGKFAKATIKSSFLSVDD